VHVPAAVMPGQLRIPLCRSSAGFCGGGWCAAVAAAGCSWSTSSTWCEQAYVVCFSVLTAVSISSDWAVRM
jgi:hypothetical protein